MRISLILLIAAFLSFSIQAAQKTEHPNEKQLKLERQLFFAVRRGTAREVETLILKGARVNCIHPNGPQSGTGTPLYQAAVESRYKIVRLLIERYGADVNLCRKSDGLTPIEAAYANSDTHLIKYFRDYGAKSSLPCLLLYHMEQGHIRQSIELIKRIQKKGVPRDLRHFARIIGTPIKNSATLLHFAAFHGDTDLVEFLLQNHAKVDYPVFFEDYNEEADPVDLALCKGYLKIALRLLETLKKENPVKAKWYYGELMSYLDGSLALELAVYSDSLHGLHLMEKTEQQEYLKSKEKAPKRINSNFRKYKLVLSSLMKKEES